jgi:NADH-quinone oxidoreductase subunit M
MTALWLITIPLTGGLLSWLFGRIRPAAARWIALAALVCGLPQVLVLLLSAPAAGPVDFDAAWIPSLGIRFHLAVDGLSALLIGLTYFLGLVAVGCSWREIIQRQGYYFFNLLWVLAGIIGVFSARDLFLFYFFWELMMVPMFLLIIFWGHENRIYAGIKFFLFTQFGSLFMLAAIIALYLIHGRATGEYTFNVAQLLGTTLAPATGRWLMLGFLAAFAVKLPAFPLHSWLPDAHTEAPTAGSVVLAGLLLKTGAYGMLRFALPLFPEAAHWLTPAAMVLAVAAILYGALLSFSQTDAKRMVAYTSISHMGFVMLAIFAWNELALQGAVIQIICHGVSTGALFVIVGMLQQRLHTRDLGRMGGLWAETPRLGGVAMLFVLASLGLPGLGNFIGEFVILFGVYPDHPLAAVLAATGLVAAAIYALWLIQQTFHGGSRDTTPNVSRMPDMNLRESVLMAALAIAILWLGLHPQPIFDRAGPSVTGLLQDRTVMTAQGPVFASSRPMEAAKGLKGGGHGAH